jgi:hypothetical protein
MLTDLEYLGEHRGERVGGDRLSRVQVVQHTCLHCDAGWDAEAAMPVLCTHSACVGQVGLAIPERGVKV